MTRKQAAKVLYHHLRSLTWESDEAKAARMLIKREMGVEKWRDVMEIMASAASLGRERGASG